LAVAFSKIEADFSELRDFVLFDLNLITKTPQGGNYAVALLIVTACEAAGTLRFGKTDGGSEFFREYLVPKKWYPVSKSIYDVLRNGLAHSFSTKAILKVASKPIELGISWSKEKHFEYDSSRATLFINVQELAGSMRRAFRRYEEELKEDARLRDCFVKWRKKHRVYEVRNEKEKSEWKKLLSQVT
jgi:hypothetical protein